MKKRCIICRHIGEKVPDPSRMPVASSLMFRMAGLITATGGRFSFGSIEHKIETVNQCKRWPYQLLVHDG